LTAPPARRGALVLAAAVGALLAEPGPATGQGTVHAASLEADLATEPGVARVRLRYEISDVAPGALVSVSLLDFGTAVGEDFRVGRAGAPVRMVARNGAARSGSWPVEEGPGGRSVLSVAYRVVGVGEVGDGRFVSHLPVLSVDLSPEAARPGLFQGHVRVPVDWAVTEGFPTGMSADGEQGSYSVELAVVPSVVILRARADGRRRPGLPAALDLVAIAALLATAFAGWRHMQEPAQ